MQVLNKYMIQYLPFLAPISFLRFLQYITIAPTVNQIKPREAY